MKLKEPTVYAIIEIVAVSFALVFLALTAYGGYSLYTRANRIEQVEFLQKHTNSLKLTVESLQRTCKWEEVLEQTLSPQCQAELDLVAEQVRQGKGGKSCF